MPRKNNWNSYEYEDRLGFNPNRYLASIHSNRSYGSSDAHSGTKSTRAIKTEQVAKRTRRAIFDTKPSLDRHKAHSSNRRKRRALYTIWKMQRSADRIQRTQRDQQEQRYTTPESNEMICIN